MQAIAGIGSIPHTQELGTPFEERKDGMELSGLPDTVLLSVLDCLSPKELAGTCCLVSQSMRDAALSNDLWRNRFNDLPTVSRPDLRTPLMYIRARAVSHPSLFFMQEFRAFVEGRRLYPWLWHALYHTNLLSNVNWGNITGHNNWLMNSSGAPLFRVLGVHSSYQQPATCPQPTLGVCQIRCDDPRYADGGALAHLIVGCMKSHAVPSALRMASHTAWRSWLAG